MDIEVVNETKNHGKFLEIAFAIEKESYKQQRGKSVFDTENVQIFYKALAEKMPEYMVTTVLLLNNKPIAYSIGFFTNGIFQGSQKAHLPEYNYYSPARYMLMKLLEYYKELGSPILDFGRGYDHFKKDFTKNTHPLYNILLSQSFLNKWYLFLMVLLREKIYEMTVKHKHIYTTYRIIKKKILKQD